MEIKLWVIFALFQVMLHSGSSLPSEDERQEHKLSLLMPGVVPQHPDSYLCTSIRLDPTEEYFITGFVPNTTQQIAHHMLLRGCSNPGSSDEVWSCGNMQQRYKNTNFSSSCKGGSQIIYAWARNAPSLQLPEGVAFKVGGATKTQYLVLQVHYASVESFKNGDLKDDSGVFLRYTKHPQPKNAGVLLMASRGRIMPHSTEFMEVACDIKDDITIHPFAFRVHTHALGRVVSGYKIENSTQDPVWTLIGKKDPQLPQMFYPVANEMTLSKGDMIAARCTMQSDRDTVTRTGPTADHEMCNFYIMYWRNAKEDIKVMKQCPSPGPPHFYWDKTLNLRNIPQDASTLPLTYNVVSP